MLRLHNEVESATWIEVAEECTVEDVASFDFGNASTEHWECHLECQSCFWFGLEDERLMRL